MKKRASGKSKASKNSRFNINIHLTNQWLYTLIAVGILLIIAVGVYGSSSLLTPGVAPNPGHTINQLAPPSGCSAGQVLEWNGTANSNGGWSCSNGGSGSSVWQSGSGVIYYNSGNVGIGTTSPSSTLSVGGSGVSSAGISGYGYGSSGYGVYGNAALYGIYGTSPGYGVYGSGSVAGVFGNDLFRGGTGVYGNASGGIGVYGSSDIGVEGDGASGGYDFYAAGPGTDYGSSSSIRWKTNITLINTTDALNKLMKLRPIDYTWDASHGGGNDQGYLAEEVGVLYPDVTGFTNCSQSSNWFFDNYTQQMECYASGIDYGKLAAVAAIPAIQQQEKIIMQQNQTIQELENTLNKICSNNPNLCE